MNLWRLEWLRLIRTRRWLVLGGVYLFFGFLGPLTARYMGEILERFGGDIQVTVPDPVPADGMIQFAANAQQIGLLVVVVVAAGALALDAVPEMSVFLRTRVRRMATLLAPRYVVATAAAATAFLLGTLAAWYETAVLLGSLPVGSVLLGIGYGIVYLAFAVAVVAAAASRTKGVLAAVVVTLLVLLGLPLLGLVGVLNEWLPSYLLGAQADLVGGAGGGEFLRAAVVSVAVTAGLLAAAVRGAAVREL
jgi:ABC-2 type transport system permease protein